MSKVSKELAVRRPPDGHSDSSTPTGSMWQPQDVDCTRDQWRQEMGTAK